MEQILFTSWASLGPIVVVGAMVYVGLIGLLRTSGKRTLSKMNAFDLIVTVALGSMLASTILSKSVALFDGLLGMGVLIGLQYVITWLSVRYRAVDKLVKAEPTLLVYQGRFLHDLMKAQRVTEGEILTSLRERGVDSLDKAAAVVLENDGSLTALKSTGQGSQSALGNVPGSKELTDK
ncbi:DUF421 domain-containing protein [Hymenobacter lapidiphilus]|uniref:DUF421 domain-containing protein n=1 Tax=Hymenobacter sp. CCM 8763 TaxID=2303334 RepID=UPI000E3484EE|nr:YetF domain-containing protein [Hymenobacter sp. CCM 8763]RFP65325.1 DUF421 domain-containing protein [Hymenobacter sp. CCM 8763]